MVPECILLGGSCPDGHMAPSSAVLRAESLGDRKQRGGWILL